MSRSAQTRSRFGKRLSDPESSSGRHPTALDWVLLITCSLLVPALAHTQMLFEDASQRVGVSFEHQNGATGKFYLAEIMGSGVGVFDYDGDGDLDIYLVQGGALAGESAASDRLLRNDSIEGQPDSLRFTDVTASAGIKSNGYGMGVAAGDVDGDGWTDLLVLNLGPNQLWRNRGDGTFELRPAGAPADDSWSVSASFTDYDQDGDLDIYVANYVDFTLDTAKDCFGPTGKTDYCAPVAYRGQADVLLRNRGRGDFEDVSRKALPQTGGRTGLGVVSRDFNGDGRPDFYVANDGTTNQLLLGQGSDRFVDDTLLAGAGVNANGEKEASMGADAADFDDDGDLDIFLTHLTNETNTLYRNRGQALFDDATDDLGLGSSSWPYTGFGTRFLDFDRDGDLDIIAANGAVAFFRTRALETLAQPNQLFRNDGGAFLNVSEQAGAALTLPLVSRGLAVGDLDNDGDPDVVISNNSGPAQVLLNRSADPNSWVGLLPVVTGGRAALGAMVCLEMTPRPCRVSQTDGSYGSASDPRVLFGLGESNAKDVALVVQWPDGSRERFSGLATRRYHTAAKGTGARVP